jgi:CheY-like chemotaxis protein
MHKLLVIEDEEITSDMLRRYFEIVGYEVVNATTGAEAVKMTREHRPDVILLDIMLPDMDGYEICRRLRSDERTERIPIIFLTRKGERRDRLEGLSLGVDDYITKPFDMEELRLRVHNIIDRIQGHAMVDARTGLPKEALIKERLPRLLDDPKSAYLDVSIEHFEPFGRQYGPVAANQVVRSTAKIIADLLHEIDPVNSFIGHPGDNRFLVAVPGEGIERVEQELPDRFKKRLDKFYDYGDMSRGKMKIKDKLVPLMALKLERVGAEVVKARVGEQKAGDAVKSKSADAKKPDKAAKPKTAPKAGKKKTGD